MPFADRRILHLVDVTDQAAAERVATEVVAVLGVVDGLLNVAGIIRTALPDGLLGSARSAPPS